MPNNTAPLPPHIAAIQVGLCMLWGLGQIAAKVGLTGISPLFQAGLRSIGATLVVLIWIRLRNIPINWRDGSAGPAMALGLLFTLEFVCLYEGLARTGAARATLLLYTAPFIVAAGAHWFVPGDKLTRPRVAGLVLAFAGVALAFQDRLGDSGTTSLTGDLLCLAAAFFWAGTTIMVKATRLKAVTPEQTLLVQLIISALILPTLALLIGEPGVFAASPLVMAALLYQIVVIASFTYLMWFFLMARQRATTLSVFTFLTPVFGVLFAWLLLGETISPSIVGALVLIASGIVLVNRG